MIARTLTTAWLTAMLGVAALQAHAQSITPIESAVESRTDLIALPQSTPSTVYYQPCEKCPTRSLQVNNATRFFIGKTAVELAELNKFATAHADNPPAMTLYFKASDHAVTRIVLDADVQHRPMR